MGNHRAERRDTRNGPSETLAPAGAGPYVGRRVAARTDTTETAYLSAVEESLTVSDLSLTAELTLVSTPSTPGKRRAIKHGGSRGALFRGLPSAPVLLGVATLAVAIGGTLTAGSSAQLTSTHSQVRPASALSGDSGTARVNTMRRAGDLDRSSDRQALQQASDSALVEAAEAQVEERNAALSQLASKVELQAKKLADDRWVLPTSPVVLTARFGEYGLWASYHTGLDFNGETGDPIYSVASGVVTFVGYDGSYGNKTVVTLEDGTEIWYCHQTSQYVSMGDTVTPTEVIGTIGTTGNVTGSHLHLEVRPGGGDPVDPFAAFVQHGITP